MQDEFAKYLPQIEVSLEQALDILILKINDLDLLLHRRHETIGLTAVQDELYKASKNVVSVIPQTKTYEAMNNFLAIFNAELLPLVSQPEIFLKCKADFAAPQAKLFSKTILDLTLYYSRILDFELAEREKQREKYVQ